MLLDSMHSVEIAAPPEFLPFPSPAAPHPSLPGGCTGTRASVCVNPDDTLMLSEHLVVLRHLVFSDWHSEEVVLHLACSLKVPASCISLNC